ncbi:alpha/beta hydrolase [Candidatus Shapirobacteria bacterium]|nr:alpha/beta hydrolase [Candidatus Shapirobacteria bacterium]
MELNFLEFGEGKPPIVFIHGWQQDCHSFTPLVPFLFKQRKLFLIELPGFGQSELPQKISSSKDYALAVKYWLLKKKITPVTLVGHSYGGKIATLVAYQNPKIITKLILIAPSGIPEPKIWYRFKELIPTPIKRVVRSFLVSRDYKNAGRLRPLFKNIVKEDLRPIYAKIKSPTLVIWGKEDNELSPDLGENIHQLIPNSRLEIVSGNHFVFQQNPEEIANLIANFINK